ncbi:MAG: hypothetical protein CVU50_05980 [Candidatus Cloacimonetes bacterium HGW-Cloacimonetes-3]|jgi:four helix bundle protein|nr:MAG: hypothetical protein CVU50_05980 [Candidatus Cloacimonetes bacterium HGW-Cloacimonetes-3]
MKQNVTAEKAFSFAEGIYKLNRYFVDEKKEFILAGQIRKSGKSIGADFEEALGAQSSKEFISRVSIHIEKLGKHPNG